MGTLNPYRWWRAWRHRRDDAAVVAALEVLGESSRFRVSMHTGLIQVRVYGALCRLTEAGTVTYRLWGSPPRRVYRLTEGGR